MCVVFSLSVFASDKVVRITIDLDPITIDPNLVYGPSNKLVPDHVPCLATSWEVSDDNLVWTFHLRKDVKWTDGKPVTAHDIEYGTKRVIDPATAAPRANFLYVIKNARKVNTGESDDLSSVGVKAVDDYTIQYTVEYPVAYFLPIIAHITAAVPSWVIEEYGADKWTEPENIVTNGAYKLKSWAHFNEIVLVKNEDYFDADKVQIEEAQIIYVMDYSTALAMYETGDLDTCEVPGVDIERIKSDPILSKEYYNGPLAVLGNTQINSEYPPMDNPLVRKAFAAAIDKETLIKYILKGGEQPAYTVVPPGSFGHVEEGIGIPFDPEAAKKYLADAGYPGGKGLPEVSYAFNSSDYNQNLAEALQKMWKDNLGVNVKLKALEQGIYWSSICEGAHQMWRMGNSSKFPDAHNFLYTVFHSEYGERNLRWKNNEYDKLVEDAASEMDPEKRKAFYRRAEEIIVEEDCALIPLYYYAYNILAKPYLNRTFSPYLFFQIENWKIEK
jgi:oligopeptide transport system substrate-binding protein